MCTEIRTKKQENEKAKEPKTKQTSPLPPTQNKASAFN